MSTTRINKEAVYSFLNERRSKIISEKVDPLSDEIRIMRGKIVEDILAEFGGLEKTANKFKEIYGLTLEISDKLSYAYGNLDNILRGSSSLSNQETLETHIMNSIDDTIEIEQKKAFRDNARNDINYDFKKLNEMVKRCSTGNQAFRNLKEIGFDVSSIKTTIKQELVVLKVNNDLLGLPEENNE